MIRTLSYFNLLFAVLYFLGYLQNSGAFVISGLLAVIVFNWMALRSLENEQFQWTVFHWAAAILTLSFAAFTGYTATTLLLDVVEYRYYPAPAITLISCGFIFTLAILFHLYLTLAKSIRKKSDQLFDN